MKKNIYLTFAFLFLSAKAFSCLNYYDYKLNKKTFFFDEELHMLFENIDYQLSSDPKKRGLEDLQDFKDEHKGKWNDSIASDYAALLIKTMQLKEAKTILDSLIRKKPNDYTLNSNYGTLMELMGNNHEALKYIRKAVNLDPASHENSEWIHVLILETKLQLEKNPDALTNHSLMKYDFGTDSIPKANELTDSLHKALVVQILYQLEERTYFVRPQDPIVADLFFITGNLILSADMGVIPARKAYELSLKYGTLRKSACEKRLAYLSAHFPKNYAGEPDSSASHQKNNEKKPKRSNTFLFSFPPFLAILVALIARNRRRKRKALQNASSENKHDT